MSTQETQARLLGGPSGESATIATSGRVIRPSLTIATALVDECKMHLTEDGINLVAIDPANVGMVDLTIHKQAFEAYAVDVEDELLTGINLSGLMSKLSNARMGKASDDPVEIDVDQTRTVLEIRREYSSSKVRYADEQLNIDPDSIRQEPNMPNLELKASADVDIDAFKDAIAHIDTSTDHVIFRVRDGSLVLTGGSNDDSPADYASAVEIEDAVEYDEEPDDEPIAKFSLDYMVDFARAVKKSKADTLTLRWDEEMPVMMDFSRSIEDEKVFTATYMLAPRVHSED